MLGREWISDGGLADNVPLLPVLMGDVDYVVVIALNPSEAAIYRSPDQLRAHIQQLSRERWAARLTLEAANRYYSEYIRRYEDSPDHVPVADLLPPEHHTKEIGVIVLSPSRTLARIDLPYLKFITGTINSAIPSRRKWFATGYRDTLRSLRAPDDSVPIYVQFTLLEDEGLN
jgi:hypothetical protein